MSAIVLPNKSDFVADSPPLRYRIPFARGFLSPALTFFLTHLKNRSKSVTARPITKSNGSLKSSTRICFVCTFLSPRASTMAFTTRTFLPMESIKVKLTPGNMMAKGIPGNPPPVPTSSIVVPSTKRQIFPNARLGSMCRSSRESMSFRDITLIFVFQSRTASPRSSNCAHWFSPSSGNIFLNASKPLFLFHKPDFPVDLPQDLIGLLLGNIGSRF